jgi:hypothetical protein
MMHVIVHSHTSAGMCDAPDGPPWAARVPRWAQLDSASYALAEAWHAWQLAPPDAFVAASRQASALADLAFARRGAVSPARFVATLPSVAVSALLQVAGWTGPLLCVQNGKRTLLTALEEAAARTAAGPDVRVGVLSHEVAAWTDASPVRVWYYELSREPPASTKGRAMILQPSSDAAVAETDADLAAFVDAAAPRARAFHVGPELCLVHT